MDQMPQEPFLSVPFHDLARLYFRNICNKARDECFGWTLQWYTHIINRLLLDHNFLTIWCLTSIIIYLMISSIWEEYLENNPSPSCSFLLWIFIERQKWQRLLLAAMLSSSSRLHCRSHVSTQTNTHTRTQSWTSSSLASLEGFNCEKRVRSFLRPPPTWSIKRNTNRGDAWTHT